MSRSGSGKSTVYVAADFGIGHDLAVLMVRRFSRRMALGAQDGVLELGQLGGVREQFEGLGQAGHDVCPRQHLPNAGRYYHALLPSADVLAHCEDSGAWRQGGVLVDQGELQVEVLPERGILDPGHDFQALGRHHVGAR